MDSTKGMIEVIVGPMFSGKSEELIRRVNRLNYAKINYLVFKPMIDTRENNSIKSRNGKKLKAINISSIEKINKLINEYKPQVVIVDEIQFFDRKISSLLNELANKGIKIIAAGLDKDFRGIPFGPMPELLAHADKIYKLNAVCLNCGKNAIFTQRLVNGEPANFHEPIIQIGSSESYEARCRDHHEIPGKPEYL